VVEAISILGQTILVLVGLALVVSLIDFVLIMVRKIVRELKALSVIE
jgi:hypothetical protein